MPENDEPFSAVDSSAALKLFKTVWMLVLLLLISCAAGAEGLNYSEIMTGISRDLAGFAEEHPLLQDFSSAKHVHLQSLTIDYAFKTRNAPWIRGWLAGVPHPDPGGVWLYIEFHDPDSKAQLHTQPVIPGARIGSKDVLCLWIAITRHALPVAFLFPDPKTKQPDTDPFFSNLHNGEGLKLWGAG